MSARFLGIFICLLSSSASEAADAGRAAVDWSAPYFGISGGYGWLRDVDRSFTPALRSSGDDVVFGAHAGYLHQFGAFVLGGEAEYTRLDINFEGFPIDVENAFSAKARAGFAFDRLLLTGHAGATYITTNIGLEDWGWVAGAGADYLLSDNLVAGVSWDHMQFDRFDGTLIDGQLDLVKARVSFRF
ncbi:outer membrane beta-barrel protein [Pseudaminobacter sp. 19-2017]|uniref:Outer membrane beta-barrel protein n=1 Tax=Pseudaminobacter soli (ex Zhang et al. 2022) TaxID=2831468 RepID=A0A942E1U7_9HYPH|nr:outer membrane beta-barrel protein [Pseudaminobacter soli]MBS3651568.1 outer membrane beta-barrel protein [Pseudaminobacter soli]